MRTDFVHWYPLAEGESHAPEGPGVLQVKVRSGLLSYPGGKSAMVHYAAAQNLRSAVGKLAQVRGDQDFLCRHQPCEEADVLLAFVLGQFERRFGAAPSWPE